MARGERTGRKRPDDPEAVKQALERIMTRPTVDVLTLSTATGAGRNQIYAEAQAGRWGAFRIGAVFHFPTAVVREALHLPASPILAPASHEHAAEAA